MFLYIIIIIIISLFGNGKNIQSIFILCSPIKIIVIFPVM
uniref:Uncharacterized protein n=1 Tax=Anguilla anguilla TaxID=7936 RepID=A0A0E9R6D0_ANGAN